MGAGNHGIHGKIKGQHKLHLIMTLFFVVFILRFIVKLRFPQNEPKAKSTYTAALPYLKPNSLSI